MARELKGAGQARRAGMWDEVRPEGLVPRERDPLTGRLRGGAGSEGDAKDRPTESSRSAPSHASATRPLGVGARRWLPVAAVGVAALVIGIGGAVAVMGGDDEVDTALPVPTTTAAGAPTPGPAPSTSAPAAGGGPGPGRSEYRGTLTSTADGEVLSSGEHLAAVDCQTECRLLSIAVLGEDLESWPLDASDVTLEIPQQGESADMCSDGFDFSPARTWRISVTDERLTFTRTQEAAEATCADGVTRFYSEALVEFEGTRVP